MISGEYVLSSWLISKGLALGYIIAFMSLLPQVLGLFGQRGILSIDHLLNLLDNEMKGERFFHIPSLFWFSSSDAVLRGLCFLGLVAGSLAFLGFSQTYMFLICFICYLSFVSCGQIFLSYQWDSLLLEIGFLGLFFAPFEFEWLVEEIHVLNPAILGLVWLLLFKLMFLSGVVKLVNKDPTWRNLSAMSYHYWTQPLPTPIAYWVHKLPFAFHRISTAMMFFVELIVPFAIFFDQKPRAIAAALLTMLQVGIMLTGNYAFFNLITIFMSLSLVSDEIWKGVLGTTLNISDWLLVPLPGIHQTLGFFVALVLVPPSIFWIAKTLREKSKVVDFFLPVMRLLYPFRISNPYGLFAVMTKARPEIIFEGSNDGAIWKSYVFKYKPVHPDKPIKWVAPHQPRLDWQMWFAALESFTENLWLQNLIVRVFENSPDVLGLFEHNPFPDKPPQYLRLTLHDYRFSTFKELRTEGVWWVRKPLAMYSPSFEVNDFKTPES